MGRNKKYHSDGELKEAKKKQWRAYYEKNKEKINSYRMKKYYDGKETDSSLPTS
jgi:hypothetical protein